MFISVYHSVALLSVLPNWHDFHQYNLHELIEDKQRGGMPVETSGGGGYP